MTLARSRVCIATAVLLLACSSSEPDIAPITDDGEEGPPAEAADPPSPTRDDDGEDPDEPEADDDPFAVPEDIDEDYLQSVADELMAIRTDAVRYAVANNGELISPDEHLAGLIGSIYTGNSLTPALSNVSDILVATNVEEVFFDPDEMSDQELEVFELVGGDSDCVTFIGRYDFGGTERAPGDERPNFAIVGQHLPDQEGTNVTGWQLYESISLLDPETDQPIPREELGDLSIEALAEAGVPTDCGQSDD